MFKTTDKISQPSRGSIAQAKAYVKTPATRAVFVSDYLNELWRLCAIAQLDFGILFAQFCDETDRGTSDIFLNEGNPAGIGKFPDGTSQSRIYKTGKEAAQAHVVHMHAYVHGRIPASSLLFPYVALDPRYNAAITKYGGQVQTIAGLAGRWATNLNYANQIVDHANTAFASAPSEVPNMSTPTIIDKYLHVTQDGYQGVNRRYPGQNGHKIIVLHIQEGTSWGSWTWFHNTTASATVFVNRDGSIWRLVPESDGPWTNGDVCSPTAVGRRVIDAYGSDPNFYTLSIETEGYASSNNPMGWLSWPKPQAQLDAVVWQVKDWMTRYNIPIENVVRHADLNQCSRPGCPGDAFYNYVVARVKDESTVEPSTEYAKRHPVIGPDGKKWNGTKDIEVNGATFHAEKRTVTVANVGVFREYASVKSGRTRSDMKGGKVSVLGWVNGESVQGENRWWITSTYSRFHVSGSVEKPSAPAVPLPDDTDPQNPNETPDRPDGVTIVNGRAYYEVRPITGTELLKLVITKDVNGQRSVVKGGKSYKKFTKGDEVEAAFFVVGDEIDKESIWWVLSTDDGTNPIHHGLRIPASATNVRPD